MTSIIDECPSNLNMRRRILSSEFIGTIYLMSWNRVKYVPCILHHCITAVKYDRAQINICTEPLHSTGLDGHFSVSAWGVRWCRWCEVWCEVRCRIHYEKIDLFSISCRILLLQVHCAPSQANQAECAIVAMDPSQNFALKVWQRGNAALCSSKKLVHNLGADQKILNRHYLTASETKIFTKFQPHRDQNAVTQSYKSDNKSLAGPRHRPLQLTSSCRFPDPLSQYHTSCGHHQRKARTGISRGVWRGRGSIYASTVFLTQQSMNFICDFSGSRHFPHWMYS